MKRNAISNLEFLVDTSRNLEDILFQRLLK